MPHSGIQITVVMIWQISNCMHYAKQKAPYGGMEPPIISVAGPQNSADAETNTLGSLS